MYSKKKKKMNRMWQQFVGTKEQFDFHMKQFNDNVQWNISKGLELFCDFTNRKSKVRRMKSVEYVFKDYELK